MDHDELVNRRVKQIARDHGVTVADVHAALDRHPLEVNRDQYLRRVLALELIELDQLQQAFREKALVDGDVGAGALWLKIQERREVLLGISAPAGHAVTIVQHEPAAAETSTDKIRAAIDHVRGIAPPKQSEEDTPN